jgi:hypothetical protein
MQLLQHHLLAQQRQTVVVLQQHLPLHLHLKLQHHHHQQPHQYQNQPQPHHHHQLVMRVLLVLRLLPQHHQQLQVTAAAVQVHLGDLPLLLSVPVTAAVQEHSHQLHSNHLPQAVQAAAALHHQLAHLLHHQ